MRVEGGQYAGIRSGIGTESLEQVGERQEMKAVIYARVSSSEQDKEGFSIPAQLKLLSKYAMNELRVRVAFFADLFSFFNQDYFNV